MSIYNLIHFNKEAIYWSGTSILHSSGKGKREAVGNYKRRIIKMKKMKNCQIHLTVVDSIFHPSI